MYRIEIYHRIGSDWFPVEQPAQWYGKAEVWAMYNRMVPCAHTLRIVDKAGKVVYRYDSVKGGRLA